MKLHSINNDQKLYVMPCGYGFSCYGFDVLDRKARAVAAWVANETANSAQGLRILKIYRDSGKPGTADHFHACAAVMDTGAKFAGETGKRCDAELVPALIGLEGRRVEATVYGERVRFQVGKSTGWMPCHIQLHNRASNGGCALQHDDVTNVKVIR